MPLVVKVCGGVWENFSRDKRELSVCQALGADVAVVAKGNAEDRGRVEYVDGFKVYRYSTRPIRAHCPAALNRLISLFTWAAFIRNMNPDVLSGHDLLPGLTICWMASLWKKKKPALVYDSHEFELGRNKKRGKLCVFFVKQWERFLMTRCAFSVMVNDTIADEVMKIHHLKKRPLVVRSTPSYWFMNQEECEKTRVELLKALFHAENKSNSKSENRPFLVLYHGLLTTERGIEMLIRLVAHNSQIYGVILGNGEEKYVKGLHDLVKKLEVEDRVVFHPAVPLSELWKYIGSVDVCLMPIQSTMKSYYYSLPNKFFESIQAETPIVASDFPEMKSIIERYGIGLTCSPDNLEDINACVEHLRLDNDFYSKCKNNLKVAKAELCWEKEKDVLEEAYERILPR